MGWIYIILTALDLAGVYFNVRMLLSCFTVEPKRPCLRKYRPLVICQFVYQVSVLAMNSIETWSGFDVQHDEPCNVFKMTWICINIFLVSNLVAMLIVEVQQPITYNNQELSPKLLMLVPVCLGFIGCAIVWCSCSSLHEFESQVIAIIFFVVFLPLLLVTWKEYAQRDQTSEKVDAALLWATFKQNKKVCAVTVWLLICCAVVIGSGAPSRSPSEEFDGKIISVFMVNSVVGIGLPATFNELFDSIYENVKETKTVVII